ncbi:hypothetical protein ENBRE01_0993 [Enteropsectra breve]|nr:hypothetical protein ENBRE01_0993 [Enteropsectra breve]
MNKELIGVSESESDSSSLSIELVVEREENKEAQDNPIQQNVAFKYDIEQMKEKPWLNPGADITDYFNYGFTERTWIRYCELQKENKEAAKKIEEELKAKDTQQNERRYKEDRDYDSRYDRRDYDDGRKDYYNDNSNRREYDNNRKEYYDKNSKRDYYDDRKEYYDDRKEYYDDRKEYYDDRRDRYGDNNRKEYYDDRRDSYGDNNRKDAYDSRDRRSNRDNRRY